MSPSDAPVFDRGVLRTATSLQKLIGKSESRHHRRTANFRPLAGELQSSPKKPTISRGSGDKDETDRIAILIGLWAGHASNGNRNISRRAG